VKEAVTQYSGWKLQDLINEYRVNYPFLNDLFVIFQHTAFILSRNGIQQKLDSIKDALVERYRDAPHIFSLDSVLQILYSIGFLGVIRAGRAKYGYEDPNAIEIDETQFVIHPAFREALRSVSSVDVRGYEPSVLVGRILSEAYALTGTVLGRPESTSRMAGYVGAVCDNVERAALDAKLPGEVLSELRLNLTRIRADAYALRDDDTRSERASWELMQEVAAFFDRLSEQLASADLVTGPGGQRLERVLERSKYELASFRRHEFRG
jgi:hypothetical protein